MTRTRHRRLAWLLCVTLLLAGSGGAYAFKGYRLSILETNDAALDAAIRAASQLKSLEASPPETMFALIGRARGDVQRIETTLSSFGYYQAEIAITVAGRNIAAPGGVSETEIADPVPVRVEIAKGPLYTLRAITLDGDAPSGARAVLDLKPGDPARAAAVLAGQPKLLAYLREQGYAFASVDAPIAYADDDAHVLDVGYRVDAKSKARIGAVSFKGLERVDEAFARRVLDLRAGEPYKTSALARGRSNLTALNVFSGVGVETADSPDDNGDAAITYVLSERKRRRVSLSIDYSTDLGVSVSAAWSHRNLLGAAEQLNLSAAGTGLGGNATSGIGYNLSAQFIKPYFLRADQQWEISAAAIKQSLDAYDQTAEIFGFYLRRNLSQRWSARAGLSAMIDDVTQKGDARHYQLFSLPMVLRYDDVETKGAVADPKGGFRTELSLTPLVSLGEKTLLFAQIQASGSAYFDMSGDGDSVLALRALAGSIQGASSFDLPPDQRLYAGGSGTVRGFRYQSIGPSFADGDPAGAASVDAVSVEWRQKVWGDWGAVAFIDAGQAGSGSLPFGGDINLAFGSGIRYYTPIGAVRFDIAVPLTKVPQNDSFQIYLSLGQAF